MLALSKRPMAIFAGMVLVSVALPTGSEDAHAAEPQSPDQIIRALKPPVRATRGLTTSPAAPPRNAEDVRFIGTLRNRTTASLTTEERNKITTISQKNPSIDLEINFEYNSDRISAQAMPQISALGQALSSADLKGGSFIVAGHTDGKGGESVNQSLSERRADAVKRYLMEKYRIDESNLVSVGYGKSQLKNASNPTGAENRRVQIINLAN